MLDPIFLTIDEVLQIHASCVREYGGSEGVRDIGLVESAIAQPQQTFGGEYVCTDMAEMAAAYLFHLCSNHAFLDGNKRTAAAAAIIFLKMNDAELPVDEEGLGTLTLAVASGKAEKIDVIAYFRSRLNMP